jgi:hypothetical protein
MRIILYTPEQDPMSSPKDRIPSAEEKPEYEIRQVLKAAMNHYLPTHQIWEHIRTRILTGAGDSKDPANKH